MEREIENQEILAIKNAIKKGDYSNRLTFSPKFKFNETGEISYGENSISPPYRISFDETNLQSDFILQCSKNGIDTVALEKTFIGAAQFLKIIPRQIQKS